MSYAFGGRPHSNNRGGFSGNRSRAPRGRAGSQKKYIDPRKFVQAAELAADKVEYISTHTFSDFIVSSIIKKNLENKGFKNPTPIQDQTIPLAVEGHDIVGIADTGTGKTAAFGIPLLNKLIENKNSRAIILAPTRELAEQIDEQFRMIAKGSGLFGTLLIGGVNMAPQLRDLSQKPNVVVGTPGRIMDHVRRGTLDLGTIDTIVLDEVDRMLDMGFVEDITLVMSGIKQERQCLFFSATLDPKVSSIINRFSKEPKKVSVKSGDTSKNVEQNIVVYTSNMNKLEKLHELLTNDQPIKALVFDDTKRAVERLAGELAERGFKVDAIHGDKSQSQRKRALAKFQRNEVKILVATDVAARGLDVPDVTHVINYSTPNTYDDYVHRIGRTGRAGKTGFAMTFLPA